MAIPRTLHAIPAPLAIHKRRLPPSRSSDDGKTKNVIAAITTPAGADHKTSGGSLTGLAFMGADHLQYANGARRGRPIQCEDRS